MVPTDRHRVKHFDMTGKVQSAQVGGTAWSNEAITGTPFIIGALRNNSTDIVQVTIQVPHSRMIGSKLDSIHIHYALQAASLAGQTIVFSGRYCWVQPGEDIPATAQWIAMSGAGLTLVLGTHNVRYYDVHTLQADIVCPSGINEGYGGMLLIDIERLNSTYTGNLAILDIDAHTPIDRDGSLNEFTD